MMNHKHDKPVLMPLFSTSRHAGRTDCQIIRKTRSSKTEMKHCARYLSLDPVMDAIKQIE